MFQHIYVGFSPKQRGHVYIVEFKRVIAMATALIDGDTLML